MSRQMASSEAKAISSLRNPRVVRVRKLAQRKHRQRQGRFLVEDLQALHMALDASIQPHEVFYCEALFEGIHAGRLLERFGSTQAELIAVAPHVMEALSERPRAQGVMAVFAAFDQPLYSLQLQPHSLVIILDRIQKPANIGMLLRTADAVGAAAVILLESCADPFGPLSVRGSMGSLFNVPLVRSTRLSELGKWLQERNVRLIGADPHCGQMWNPDVWQGRIGLVLGNERQGLSEQLRPWIDQWVQIPMVGKTESLNVAVAGSVLMYAWLQTWHFSAELTSEM